MSNTKSNLKDTNISGDMVSLSASLIVLSVLITICIFNAYCVSKDYTVEVNAYIDSYEYYDKDDYLIGYTWQGGRVYSDMHYVRTPYKYIYAYDYDGQKFTYEVWSSVERNGSIRLYINPNRPGEAIYVSSKISWKEFLNWFR